MQFSSWLDMRRISAMRPKFPILWPNSHINRHGFLDATLFLVLMQILVNLGLCFFYVTLNPDQAFVSTEESDRYAWLFILSSLFVAPWLENILMLLMAEIHELNFQRKGLFIVTPLIFGLLHVIPFTFFPTNMYLRFVSSYIGFFIFLKQYDLHKLEIGRPKALMLSSLIHFISNLTGYTTVFIYLLIFDAESIFSA
jgi:hypothetical protein